MFDLYALPHDFPDYDQAVKERDVYRKVEMLESAFSRDLVHPRFVPHLQLHEFEALLFCDPSKFDWEFIEHDKAIRELAQIASEFGNPELIDDGNMSAPSMRIINLIPEYEGRKASAGPIIAEKIGLTSLREQCKHFDAWLRSLEQLSA